MNTTNSNHSENSLCAAIRAIRALVVVFIFIPIEGEEVTLQSLASCAILSLVWILVSAPIAARVKRLFNS